MKYKLMYKYTIRFLTRGEHFENQVVIIILQVKEFVFAN